MFQTLRTIWPLLHQLRCSTHSFRNRAHRWGLVVSFPLHSGEHQTTGLRTLTCCRKEPNLCDPDVCLFLLFALRGCHCVERVAVFCWLSCAESSFRCFCASSWRSRSAIHDSLIWDQLWCGWFCCRRVVPFLPSRILSLLPTLGSLPPGVTGRVAVAHGRQGQGGGRFGGLERKGGQHFVLARGCCKEKAMEGPKDLYPALAARPASG